MVASTEPFDYRTAWSSWKWSIPEFYNIGYNLTDGNVKSGLGEKKALLWEDSEGNTATYTYSQMADCSSKFANLLRNLGVRKGDRIFFRTPNVPEFFIGFLGATKLGAIPIPSSTLFRERDVEYRLKDSGAVAALTTRKLSQEIENVKSRCKTLKNTIVSDDPSRDQIAFKESNSFSVRFETEKTLSHDVGFMMYTSGTTGDPKGVVHLQRYPVAYDNLIRYWHCYRDDDTTTCPSEIGWLLPVASPFLYGMRWGISMFFFHAIDGRFKPERWFELIEKYKITNFTASPTVYRMLLTVKDAEMTHDLSSWRHGVSAGEPLPPDTFKEAKRRFGVALLDGIGMTEVMVNVHNIPDMPLRPGSCGKPSPGVTARIVDDAGNDVNANQQGQLVIHRSHPGMFKEYWNKPEATAVVFKGDWFYGGDVLTADKDGYFWFRGRTDDLIKASGYRISPFEIESVLAEHPAVQEAAAVESPDALRGNVVKAFIVLKDEYADSIANVHDREKMIREIQDFFKQRAAPYKYPRKMEFVDDLPKTQSGKIKRKELRKREFQEKP